MPWVNRSDAVRTRWLRFHRRRSGASTSAPTRRWRARTVASVARRDVRGRRPRSEQSDRGFHQRVCRVAYGADRAKDPPGGHVREKRHVEEQNPGRFMPHSMASIHFPHANILDRPTNSQPNPRHINPGKESTRGDGSIRTRSHGGAREIPNTWHSQQQKACNDLEKRTKD